MSGQDNFTLNTRPGKGIPVGYRGRPLFISHSTGQASKRYSSGVQGQTSVHFTLHRPGQARKRHSSGVQGQTSVHFTLYRPGQARPGKGTPVGYRGRALFNSHSTHQARKGTPVGYRGRALSNSHSTGQARKRHSSGVEGQSSVHWVQGQTLYSPGKQKVLQWGTGTELCGKSMGLNHVLENGFQQISQSCNSLQGARIACW